MTQLEIVDPLTLRIHTAAAAPLLPLDLSGLPILSRIAAAVRHRKARPPPSSTAAKALSVPGRSNSPNGSAARSSC
jgi:hypothetical protein